MLASSSRAGSSAPDSVELHKCSRVGSNYQASVCAFDRIMNRRNRSAITSDKSSLVWCAYRNSEAEVDAYLEFVKVLMPSPYYCEERALLFLHHCNYDVGVARAMLNRSVCEDDDSDVASDDECEEDECFICSDGGALVCCDFSGCRKVYHLKCMGSAADTPPDGDFICNWHKCTVCHGDSVDGFRCTLCPISYCNLHLPIELRVQAARPDLCEFLCGKCQTRCNMSVSSALKSPVTTLGDGKTIAVAALPAEHTGFLTRLSDYLRRKHVTLPTKKDLHLYELYRAVTRRGGLQKVVSNVGWRGVLAELNIVQSTAAAHQLKQTYLRFLYPFEKRFFNGYIPSETLKNIWVPPVNGKHSDVVGTSEFSSKRLATLSARSFLASTTTAAADEEVEEENSAQAADADGDPLPASNSKISRRRSRVTVDPLASAHRQHTLELEKQSRAQRSQRRAVQRRTEDDDDDSCFADFDLVMQASALEAAALTAASVDQANLVSIPTFSAVATKELSSENQVQNIAVYAEHDLARIVVENGSDSNIVDVSNTTKSGSSKFGKTTAPTCVADISSDRVIFGRQLRSFLSLRSLSHTMVSAVAGVTCVVLATSQQALSGFLANRAQTVSREQMVHTSLTKWLTDYLTAEAEVLHSDVPVVSSVSVLLIDTEDTAMSVDGDQ